MRYRGFLLLGLFGFSGPAQTQEATIVFGNGVQVVKREAKKDADRMGHAYRLHRGLSRDEFATLFDVALAHNSTGCEETSSTPCLSDFYESFLQWSRANDLLDADKIFWQFLTGKSRAPSLAWDAFLEIAQTVGWILPPEVVTQEEVAEHVAFYKEVLKTRKVVLVAHSQGNYFANTSHASSLLSDRNRDSLGVIAVASPASSVAGDGPHLTLWEDPIHFVPGALYPNETNGFLIPEVEHHFFASSYLVGVNSGPRLMGLIDEVLASLETPSQAAGLIALPQTGQRSCWNSSGVSIPCTGTGQDGEIQAGAPWPTSRFQDNGDGTVLDRLTGLIWLRDIDILDTSVTWDQALAAIGDMNRGTRPNFGFTDWRLPNIREMRSLVDFGRNLPALPASYPLLGSVPRAEFWTNTSDPNRPEETHIVFLGLHDGDASRSKSGGFRGRARVCPVRGGARGETNPDFPSNVAATGQTRCWNNLGSEIACAGTGQDGEFQWGIAPPLDRFEDHGDGTVTDSLTGLMWAKDGSLAGADLSWSEALAFVAEMNAGTRPNFGYTNWRMPNVVEAASLFDYGRSFPALPAGHPFVNVRPEVWTSTSMALDEGEAFSSVNVLGFIFSNEKEGSLFIPRSVWPVRSQ